MPHIYAQNLEDLFFAQGFVQAQDRLWQMDMYRRTWSGELAEILGPLVVPHDRLARLLQYGGPWDDREWASYHPDAKRILEAFARGVNAFIDQAGDNLPVEFKLTGLKPGRWGAQTSLLRTQTAMPVSDARAEFTLARSVVELGIAEANRRANPSPWRELTAPSGLDLSTIPAEAGRALALLVTGTPRPPLLAQYAAWPGAAPNENHGALENSPGSNNWVVSGRLAPRPAARVEPRARTTHCGRHGGNISAGDRFLEPRRVAGDERTRTVRTARQSILCEPDRVVWPWRIFPAVVQRRGGSPKRSTHPGTGAAIRTMQRAETASLQ